MAARHQVERPARSRWRHALLFLLSSALGLAACGPRLNNDSDPERLESYFAQTDKPSTVLIDSIPKYCDVYTLQECLQIFEAAFDAQAAGHHVAERELTQTFLTMLRRADPEALWEESGMSLIQFELSTRVYDDRANVWRQQSILLRFNDGYGFVQYPLGRSVLESENFAEVLGAFWQIIDSHTVWNIESANWLTWRDARVSRAILSQLYAEPDSHVAHLLVDAAEVGQAVQVRLSRGFGSRRTSRGWEPPRAYQHAKYYAAGNTFLPR